MNAAQPRLRAFRRRILVTVDDRRVSGGLEDDFHRFAATLEHDGERITAVRSESPRAPRSICPDAVKPLQEFVGLGLAAAQLPIDPRLQCTHLFDLVRLMMSQAIRCRGQALPVTRDFHIEVPYPDGDRLHAEIHCNGERLLAWDLVDRRIVSAGPFEGIDFRQKAIWPEGLDTDTLEAAKLLRRGVWLGEDRSLAAAALANGPFEPRFETYSLKRLRGNCFAHQPDNQKRSTGTNGDNIRDFSDTPHQLLQD